MEYVVALFPFVTVLLLVAVVYLFGYLNRRALLDTIRVAAQSGTHLTPELVRELAQPGRQKRRGLRAGAVLLAIAAAFIVLGAALMLGSEEDASILWIMAGIAAFPGFIGIVLVLMALSARER